MGFDERIASNLYSTGEDGSIPQSRIREQIEGNDIASVLDEHYLDIDDAFGKINPELGGKKRKVVVNRIRKKQVSKIDNDHRLNEKEREALIEDVNKIAEQIKEMGRS